MKRIVVIAASALITTLAFAQASTVVVEKVQGNVIYTDVSGSESVVEGKTLPTKGSLAATGQASALLNFGRGCMVALASGQRIDLDTATSCDGWKSAVVSIPAGALGAAGAGAAAGAGTAAAVGAGTIAGVELGTVALGLVGAAGAAKLIDRSRQNSSPN